MITQTAPDPTDLRDLIAGRTPNDPGLVYRPGWRFRLVDDLDRGQGSQGMTLIITTSGYDAYNVDEGQYYGVNHYMLVPPAAYDRRSWQHWLLEQILLVERHEACEFLQIDGERPYAPSHGFGQDPYLIRELGTEEDQRTSFRNTLNT